MLFRLWNVYYYYYYYYYYYSVLCQLPAITYDNFVIRISVSCVLLSGSYEQALSWSTPLPPYIFVHAPQIVCRSLDLRLQ